MLEKARTIARELGDHTAEAKILWNLMLLSAYTGGDIDQRIAYGEQGLRLARELNLREQMAFTLNDIFYAYTGAGQWTRARQALDEASEMSTEPSLPITRLARFGVAASPIPRPGHV